MSAEPHPRLDPAPPERGRWGVLLPVERDAAGEPFGSPRPFGSPGPPELPESFDWRPPPSFRERAWRAVSVPVAVGTVVFVAALVVAIALVWLRPHGVEGPPAEVGAGATAELSLAGEGAGSGFSAGAAGENASASGAGTVFVHVVGEVLRPGVVELPLGSRVEAAIAAAGGPSEAAVLAGVNLARELVDGEQIIVPDAASAAAARAAEGGSASDSASSGGTLDLNAADARALESLPGIGPALAQRIVDWRRANGRFANVEQLLEVPGIGRKTLEGFREGVRI